MPLFKRFNECDEEKSRAAFFLENIDGRLAAEAKASERDLSGT